MSKNIKIGIKIRPLIKREKKAKKEEVWKHSGNLIHSVNVRHPCKFTFGSFLSIIKSNEFNLAEYFNFKRMYLVRSVVIRMSTPQLLIQL